MNVNLIAAVLDKDISVPESLLVAIIGIVIVFAVLAMMILILTLFKYIFRIKILSDDYVKVNKNAIVEENLGDIMADEVNDEETVVAITAAINYILQSEMSLADKQSDVVHAPFTIKSIKRVSR